MAVYFSLAISNMCRSKRMPLKCTNRKDSCIIGANVYPIFIRLLKELPITIAGANRNAVFTRFINFGYVAAIIINNAPPCECPTYCNLATLVFFRTNSIIAGTSIAPSSWRLKMIATLKMDVIFSAVEDHNMNIKLRQ